MKTRKIPLKQGGKKPKPARAQVAPDVATTLVQKIGIAVRQAREQANLTVTQAASQCGVGTRFLLDLELGKPSIKLDMAEKVAVLFGIDLEVKPRHIRASTNPARLPAPRLATMSPPKGHQNPEHWIILQHAAHQVAIACGVDALPCQGVRTSGKLSAIQIDLSLLFDDQGAPKTAFGLIPRIESDFKSIYFPAIVPTMREEFGGHGLDYIFDQVLRQSSFPIQDIEKVIRWAALSVALLGFDVHAGQVAFVKDENGTRLAPFALMSCYSSLLSERDFKGFRIGGSWHENHLRATNWQALAKQSGVHPKFVYHILKEFSTRVPRLLEDAVHQAMGGFPRFGSIIKMISDVRKSCERLNDIALLASRSVSGMNVKRGQPRIKALDPLLVIKPSVSVLANDE